MAIICAVSNDQSGLPIQQENGGAEKSENGAGPLSSESQHLLVLRRCSGVPVSNDALKILNSLIYSRVHIRRACNRFLSLVCSFGTA